MNFLSGQDDFFRTGNQPISVRHLSQPYNNNVYLSMLKKRSENCLSMREFSSPTPVYFARLKKCIRISRKTKTMLSTTLF